MALKKKLVLKLMTLSLLFAFSSCQKESITPDGSADVNTDTESISENDTDRKTEPETTVSGEISEEKKKVQAIFDAMNSSLTLEALQIESFPSIENFQLSDIVRPEIEEQENVMQRISREYHPDAYGKAVCTDRVYKFNLKERKETYLYLSHSPHSDNYGTRWVKYYDEFSRPTKEIYYGNHIHPTSVTLYYYDDANHFITVYKAEDSDGSGDLEYRSRDYQQYDEDGTLLEETTYADYTDEEHLEYHYKIERNEQKDIVYYNYYYYEWYETYSLVSREYAYDCEYDDSGKLVKKTITNLADDSADLFGTVDYEYEEDGNLLKEDEIHYAASEEGKIVNYERRYTYTYDEAGNLESSLDYLYQNGGTFQTQYTYDRFGNVLTEGYSWISGYEDITSSLTYHYTYRYDEEGRFLGKDMRTIAGAEIRNSVNWEYDENGRVNHATVEKYNNDKAALDMYSDETKTYFENGSLDTYVKTGYEDDGTACLSKAVVVSYSENYDAGLDFEGDNVSTASLDSGIFSWN